jgi:hypothetical protein
VFFVLFVVHCPTTRKQFQSDPDLQALRSLNDFKKLLAAVEQKAKTKAP